MPGSSFCLWMFTTRPAGSFKAIHSPPAILGFIDAELFSTAFHPSGNFTEKPYLTLE